MNSPSFPTSPRRFQPVFARIQTTWGLLLMCLALLVAVPIQAQLPVKVNFESGTITLASGQAASTTWQSFTFTRNFNGLVPVVIMGPAYSADGEPHVIRVRNITATGFQWQIDEWDYLAGAHTGAVTAQFVAATQGTHVFGSQRWQVGKVTGVNRTNTTVTLTGFSAPPMVLTQVESTANLIATDNPRALKTRNSAVTAANFAVNIETQESYTTAITNENIGYIAVSEGIGYLDGKTLWAYSPGTVTNAIKTFYAGPFTNPVMIAQTQTKNDTNPGDLRMSSLPIPASGQTRFQVAFEEETSASTDVTHGAEDFAGIFIGDMPGEAAAKLVFGTVTPAQTSATLWHKVNLATAYTAPVVVFGPLTKNDAQAAGIRVRNVLAADPLNSNRASFEYQVDEWDFADGIHALETVQYMVMEEGIFAIGGQVIQAGRQTGVTNVAQTIYTSTEYWASDIYFEREPAVFAQVTTTAEASAVTARVDSVDTFYDWPANFRLRLTEAENANQTHLAETVHYIVIPGGIGQFMSTNTNFRFACGVASNLSSTLTNNSFIQKYAKPSVFAAAQGTEEAVLDIDGFYETTIATDLDPILIRQTALNAGSVNLVADEDASPSANNTHTAEVGGWFVVQGQADADGDGVTDTDETQMGTSSSLATSPNNASSGTATDFDTLQSLLSLTVTAPTATAYETNDRKATTLSSTNAVLRLQRSSGTMQLTLRVTPSNGSTDITKSNAAPADYSIAGVSGGNIVVAAGQATTASPLNIAVTPVRDSTMEVPEHLKVAFGPVPAGANPQIVNPSVNIRICDSPNTNVNNRTMYVAYLSRGPGVISTGSGVAVAQVEGENDDAKVSVTVGGLSSPQNTTYLRINTDQDIRNNLGVGDLSNIQWFIRAAATETTDQAMLDALRNGRIYCDINTVNYTAGEILGYFNLGQGGPEFDPDREDLIEPALPGSLTFAQAERDIYRFLDQCTFGANDTLFNAVRAKIDAIDAIADGVTSANLKAGYTAWLNDQMNASLAPIPNFMSLVMAADNEEFLMRGAKPIQAGNDPQFAGAGYTATYDTFGNITNPYNNASNNAYAFNYPQNGINRRREWWTMVLQSKDQVRQRMAAALQEIVVISENDTTVASRHYGAANYWDMLAQGAFGKYRDILEKVTYSPMMGIYLSHLRNRAKYTSGGVEIFPDENYAREIMQLFTIGLVLRHPDGGLVLSTSTGLPIPTYDQTDITELARVMTGLTYGARHATVSVRRTGQGGVLVPTNVAASSQIEFQGLNYTDFTGSAGELFYQAPWIYPMKALGRASGVVYHDFNPYVDPLGNVSSSVSKVLFAGKAGATQIPLVNITGMSDLQTHPLADNELRLAHNALAGNPLSSTYDGHPNTPVFISRLLIQRLTTSNPSPGYLYRVSEVYRSTNGNLGEVLKKILLDYEARSLVIPDTLPGAGKLKEPMVQFASMLRSLKVSSGAAITNLQNMTLNFSGSDSPSTSAYASTEVSKFQSGATRIRMPDLTTVIGQSPQKAPSVFNWFLPDYVQPGDMAEANLFGPELQINTESTLVNRVNRHYAINLMGLTGGLPGFSMDDFTVNSANMAPEVLTDVTTLTFDATNWNVAQTVTVRGHENLAGDGTRSTSILHSIASGDANYSGTYTAPLSFTVKDNDAIQAKLVVIAQSGGSTAVTEGSPGDTYTVVLTAPPATGTVTVTPSAVIPWQVAAAPGASPDVTISPASLTFTTSNWSTPQTVTVTAADNAAVNSYLVASAPLNARVAAIRHTITSTDADYAGTQVSEFNCTVTDNETGRRFVPTKATATGIPVVTEGLTTDTYTVAFAAGTAPTQPVTLTFNYDNSRLDLSSTDGTFAKPSAGVATVSFTSSTYATAKTITITAVNDSTYQGVQFSTITHSTASTDTAYQGLPCASIPVRVNDNDSAANNGISIVHTWGTTTAVEGGMTDQYFVVLDKAPTGSVTLTWSGNSGDVSGVGNPVFTTSNWYVPQAVTVSGTEDLSVETTHNSTIKYTASGGGYTNIRTLTATIGDNDQNSSAAFVVTQSSGTTAVAEAGATDTFDIKLSGAPAGNVLVTPTVTPAEATLSSPGLVGGVLTFTPNNWSTAQVVTVTANDDATPEGTHTAAVGFAVASTDPRYNNFVVADIPVTITDNDNGARLVFTPTSGMTEVVEGGITDTINVNFAGSTAPSGNVVVTFTGTAQASVSPASLTFTSANWLTAQPITITATNDGVTEGFTVETITANTDNLQPAGFASLTGTTSATILDNDDLNNGGAISIVQTNTATRVIEGGMTDTFEVVLRRAPTATVTLTPTFAPAGQATLSAGNLTFTTANWFIPQLVTVTAVDDATVEGAHTTVLTYTANAAGGYVTQDNVTLTISIGDNEASNPSVTISPTTGSVTEGGATFVYNVTIGAPPNAGATVRVTPAAYWNNATNTAQVTFSPTSVDFTNATSGTTQWNRVATITVTATDSTLAEALTNLTIVNSVNTTVANTDLRYVGMVSPDIALAVNDNDTNVGRIVITESSNSTLLLEDAGTDTITVALTGPSAPASDVTVNLARTTNQFRFVVNSLPVDTATLTFTPANYTTPQTVTLVSVADTTSEGVHGDTLVASTTTTAPANYTSMSTSMPMRILDSDDIVRSLITLVHTNTTTRVVEGGATDTYSIYLRRAPTANVTLTAHYNSQLSLSPANLTFTSANWNKPQVVTVTAVDDIEVENAHSSVVNYTASATGGYLVTDTATTGAISIGDNEVPSTALVTVTESSGFTWLAETNAPTDTYTVVLGAQPKSNVVLTPQAYNSVGGTNLVTFSPSTLTFTTANWNTPQTVTITLAPSTATTTTRAVFIGHTITSTDLAYRGYAVPNINAIVSDANETTAAVSILPTGAATTVNEGSIGNTDTVYVFLRKPPTADVIVTPSMGTAGQVNFSPATLTFTTANWNRPQILTLTAVNDTVVEASPATVVLTCTPAATGGYVATNVGTHNILVNDNDATGQLVITAGNTTVQEGGVTTYTVRLSSIPTAPVVVTIITEKHARPTSNHALQFGYFTNGATVSNQQKDNVLFDWNELINLYTAAYHADRGATAESTTTAPNGHLAGTKAVIDKLDLLWGGGRMKAKWPDGSSATDNPRLVIIEGIHNSYSLTRLSTDTVNFPNEVLNRCRYAAYLVSVSPTAVTSH